MSTTTCLRCQSPNETKKHSFQRQIVIGTNSVEKQLLVTERGVDALSLDDRTQSALLLNGVRERYTLVSGYAIPKLQDKDEILIKVIRIIKLSVHNTPLSINLFFPLPDIRDRP